MSAFNWLPVLKQLQGKRPSHESFGFVAGVWVEAYEGQIYAFDDEFKTRHAISMEAAKAIYQRDMRQPTLFEM